MKRMFRKMPPVGSWSINCCSAKAVRKNKKKAPLTISNTLSLADSDPYTTTQPAWTNTVCVFLHVKLLSYIIGNDPVIMGFCRAFSCSPCGILYLLHWRDACDTEMTIKRTHKRAVTQQTGDIWCSDGEAAMTQYWPSGVRTHSFCDAHVHRHTVVNTGRTCELTFILKADWLSHFFSFFFKDDCSFDRM